MTLQPLQRRDLPAAAAVIARAFHTFPFTVHLAPDASRRPAILAREYAAYLRHVFVPLGHVDVTDDLSGVALWMPPGASVSLVRTLRLVPALVRAYGLRSMGRVVRTNQALDATVPDESHAYLAVLAVDPACQGRGVGTALLRHGLDRADRDRSPVYLQAGTSRNVTLYRRHGFETIHPVDIPDGPRLWGMWRPPRDAPSAPPGASLPDGR